MKLKDLAKQPQLIKLILDDEDIVKEYGEPLDFWTWDRQPMDMFLKIAARGSEDMGEMVNVLKDLVLDEDGNKVMVDGLVLPSKVLMATFSKMVSILGK
jgi:hypothetical protein